MKPRGAHFWKPKGYLDVLSVFLKNVLFCQAFEVYISLRSHPFLLPKYSQQNTKPIRTA